MSADYFRLASLAVFYLHIWRVFQAVFPAAAAAVQPAARLAPAGRPDGGGGGRRPAHGAPDASLPPGGQHQRRVRSVTGTQVIQGHWVRCTGHRVRAADGGHGSLVS